jgi:hypothetical protein
LFGSIYTSIHFERVGYSIRTNTDAHAGRDLEPTLEALFGFFDAYNLGRHRFL